ncbi:MAG: DUF4474 domain-containing protein [Clostridia bacterium]|nr:DUF4474 domain-containing protein [Clostridia bacterium]
MKKNFTKTRITALISALIFVFSLVLSGCSNGKDIESPEKTTEKKDVINIGEGDPTIPPDSQIVIGDDGQSYLVDSEGNSIVYNHYYQNPVTPQPNTPPSNTPGVPEESTSSTTKPTVPTLPSSTESTTSIFNLISSKRSVGYNKATASSAAIPDSYLDTLRVYFTYNNKDWLIEFWKGEYGKAHVGGEVGIYTNSTPSSTGTDYLHASIGEAKVFNAAGHSDRLNCSVQLWQYVKSTDPEPISIASTAMKVCQRNYGFKEGVLENVKYRSTIVMSAKIEFPTLDMLDLFTFALDEKGFQEASTSSYKDVERYYVDDRTVTVNWRYHNDG